MHDFYLVMKMLSGCEHIACIPPYERDDASSGVEHGPVMEQTGRTTRSLHIRPNC